MSEKFRLEKNVANCESPSFHLHTGGWKKSRATCRVYYPPTNTEDKAEIRRVLKEIEHMLLNRADGVSIAITRSPVFPRENGKHIIDGVLIKTWDCAA
jgi:hypothetical protein